MNELYGERKRQPGAFMSLAVFGAAIIILLSGLLKNHKLS